jgi:hypothetical protein
MKGIFGFVSLLITACAFGQDFSDFGARANNPAVTLKKSDAQILESANYIMNHPTDPLDPIRNDAMATVLLWMVNTPDYTFFIDETIVPMIKKDSEILAIYMASMTQFVLENPHYANNRDEIKLQAFTKLLAYCDNPVNNIEKSKAITEAIYAMRAGWLKEYLKIS